MSHLDFLKKEFLTCIKVWLSWICLFLLSSWGVMLVSTLQTPTLVKRNVIFCTKTLGGGVIGIFLDIKYKDKVFHSHRKGSRTWAWLQGQSWAKPHNKFPGLMFFLKWCFVRLSPVMHNQCFEFKYNRHYNGLSVWLQFATLIFFLVISCNSPEQYMTREKGKK